MPDSKRHTGFQPVPGRSEEDPRLLVSHQVRRRLGMPSPSLYTAIGTLLHEHLEIEKQRLPKLTIRYIGSPVAGTLLSGLHIPLTNTAVVNVCTSPMERLSNKEIWESTIHQASHLADSQNRRLYSLAHIAGRQAFSSAIGYAAHRINVMPEVMLLPLMQSSTIGFMARVALLEPILPTEIVAQQRVDELASLQIAEGQVIFPGLEPSPIGRSSELVNATG